jgi:hypothetical protein
VKGLAKILGAGGKSAGTALKNALEKLSPSLRARLASSGLLKGFEGAAETAKVLPRFQPGRWLPHFEKHAAEFGYKTPILAGADRDVSARLELAPEERDELARLLGDDSLGALLQDWSRFVTEVERGYDDSIYEYTNDLSVRARLDGVVAGASAGLRAQLERALAEDDRRFAAATEEAARPLGNSRWAQRVPTRRTAELGEDLAALGYLA